MGFRKFVQSLSPANFVPGDYIDFSGTVEDVATLASSEGDYIDFSGTVEDVATLASSESFDGNVVQDSGVLSDEYSLEIVTNPLSFLQTIKPYGDIVIVVSVPAGASGNIFTTGDEIISVANAAGESTVTIGTETSPSFPEGTWHILVLSGTTWTVQQLDDTVTDALKLQNVLVFSSLTATEISDLVNVALSNRIVRSVQEPGVTVADNGTTTISTDWHIVSV